MGKRLAVIVGVALAVGAALVLVLVPESRSALTGLFQNSGTFAGKPKEEWARQLKDSDEKVRRKAYRALAYVPEDQNPPTGVYVALLKDEDPRVRADGAELLGTMGSRCKDTIPDLTAALKDKDATVRSKAAEALGKMPPDSKSAVPQLAEQLKDESPLAVRGALAGLAGIGPDAKSAFDAIMDLYKKTKDDGTKRNCVYALISIDEPRANKEGVYKPEFKKPPPPVGG